MALRLGIDYIKWDHNKYVTEAVSPRTGRPAVHGQTLAVYRMFHDLKTSHPGLEIESCSSGGGRVDMGILELADRIWASDCVDPVERADIQRYTSLLVPPEMIGEHVGASPAHSTHRATSQEMRMSDCVDPVERADIQRYTSLLVPPEMIGEHVGASPAHSTHRATSQEMRMAMAFFGHLGIEWNLLKEPQHDLDLLGEWVRAYKEHRVDFEHGDEHA